MNPKTRKFLTVLCIAALVAVTAILVSVRPACAAQPYCPSCQRQQPVLYAPAKPVFPTPLRDALRSATPVRSAWHYFMTPDGVQLKGYLVEQPALTREQILFNAKYWNEQAARLAPPPVEYVPPQHP